MSKQCLLPIKVWISLVGILEVVEVGEPDEGRVVDVKHGGPFSPTGVGPGESRVGASGDVRPATVVPEEGGVFPLAAEGEGGGGGEKQEEGKG